MTTASPTAAPRFPDVAEAAIELTRELIRVDTSNPPGNETAAATVLQSWLAARGVESHLIGPDPDRYNLVASIDGRGDGPSLALCGHLDTVPIGEEAAWLHPPLSGALEEGFVWGRGAVDMKGQVATRAAAFAALVQAGVVPRGAVRLIAQADEEVNTANVGMSWLVRNRPDLRTDWALEEGGGRHLTLPDGRIAVLYGIADKALVPLELHTFGPGGHGSRPGAVHNPVFTLARLIAAIEHAPVEHELVPEAERMLRLLAGDGAPPDGASADELLAAAMLSVPGLEAGLDAITRITYTPTRLHGSPAVNVIPHHATAEIDCRILPDHEQGVALEQLERIIAQAARPDEEWALAVTADAVGGSSSAPVPEFTEACRRSLVRVDDRQIVLIPAMNPFFTDASHLRRVWGTVTYGLWPWWHTLPADYLGGVHAPNERVKADDIGYAARWHLELLLDLAGEA